jgi:hypothetical protein
MVAAAALACVAVRSDAAAGHKAPAGQREFNVRCPAKDLLPKLDLAYHRCNNGHRDSCESFVTLFRQALPEYDCQRTFDQGYVVSALWLADAASEDYIRLLSRLKFPAAVRLFGSPEFREILDGDLAERYGPLSWKAARRLNATK